MKARILLATALVTLAALPAAAQSIKLSFNGGKVDLSAENASVKRPGPPKAIIEPATPSCFKS